MSAKCYADPLDYAANVCDNCYGDFCDDHLVYPAYRKHPICLPCALSLSGVRSNTNAQLVGNPKTAKQRRADFQDRTNHDFDARLPSECDENNEDIISINLSSYIDREFQVADEAEKPGPQPTTAKKRSNRPRIPVQEPPARHRLPPAVTSSGTILDQIVEEKQSRAQKIALELANRNSPA